MATILCIEDSTEFFLYLTSVLYDHSLVRAESLADSFKMLQAGRFSFDLILLDISLPDGNGVKALPNFKEFLNERQIPIVVLSAESDVLSKVAAFGVGADDYIVKPPDTSELRARIEVRLRSSSQSSRDSKQVMVGDLLIDSGRMAVLHLDPKPEQEPINLTPHEFKILRLLASRPGQVFSRDQLIDRVWGIGKFVSERTVDAHVSHLRKKIGQSRVRIETVLSAGYKVEVSANI